tara:strand:+ start:58754 stop:59209 length:456 start_codon:yes stop_codon:yes gene_type:complete
MRKILLLLLLFISSLGYSQVKITPILIPYVDEFIEEAKNRNIDVIPDLLKLEYIILAASPNKLGLYSEYNKIIYINYFIINDDMMARAVIFHELFHALYKLDHCHEEGLDLMCASKPLRFTFAYYHNDEVWHNELEKSFNRAKKVISKRKN